ncbi:NAD(P)/FAD-dependent oxidoreductase [Saccharopolyspora karakumensis]|nr:FAD-binding oxidoreductase [Saccharopolyspora karakumensis]
MILDKADVVVVGGGIVGVTTAYYLSSKGHDVVLVEQNELAHGASGRNMGFLLTHNRNAGYQLELSRAGRALYDEFFAELGPSFEYQSNGAVTYFVTDDQRRVYSEFVEARRAIGVEVELLDAQAAREAAPVLGPNILGAVYCPDDGQIRTPKFVRAVAQAGRRSGLRVYEHNAAFGLLRDGSRTVGVRTAGGDISSGQVVWCTGSWATMLAAEGVDVPIVMQRLGAVMFGKIEERLDKILSGPLTAKNYACFRELPSYRDEYFTSSYEDLDGGIEHLESICRTEDGNLFVGCPMDRVDVVEHRISTMGLHLTIGALLEAFPQYRDLPVEGVWSGVLPGTADSFPIVDRVPQVPGLILATGHSYGNVTGPITGKLVSELVSGEDTSLSIKELAYDRPGLAIDDGGINRW